MNVIEEAVKEAEAREATTEALRIKGASHITEISIMHQQRMQDISSMLEKIQDNPAMQGFDTEMRAGEVTWRIKPVARIGGALRISLRVTGASIASFSGGKIWDVDTYMLPSVSDMYIYTGLYQDQISKQGPIKYIASRSAGFRGMNDFGPFLVQYLADVIEYSKS